MNENEMELLAGIVSGVGKTNGGWSIHLKLLYLWRKIMKRNEQRGMGTASAELAA